MARKRRAAQLTIAFLTLAAAPPGAMSSTQATPDAKEVLADLGFPADTEQKVLAGKFVKADLASTSDRDVAVGIAFLVALSPKELLAKLETGLLLQVDPDAIHSQVIQSGSADFASLSLELRGKNLTDAFRNAKPGSDLNLSKEEIAAFQALKGQPDAVIAEQVRQMLTARYVAYKAGGLDGIAPYARDRGRDYDPSGDLGAISKVNASKKLAPDFYATLNHYPASRPEGLIEVFRWVTYEAHGTPVFQLIHAFAIEEGDAVGVCQRQFYVSGSYNSVQATAAFLPVKEGTLVAYSNHTSSDQVTGFGGSGKRAIGERVMAGQLEVLFEKLQAATD